MPVNLVTDIPQSLKLEVQTVRHLCRTINTPRALTVDLLVEAGEWEQLLELTIDPSLYEDASTFADDYLVTEVLRKSPNLPLGIDRAKCALDAFYNAELQCAFSNERILNDPHPSWTERFKKEVFKVLGPLAKKDLDFMSEKFRFGPGSTTGVRGVGYTASEKFDAPLHLTKDLIPFFRSVIGDVWWEHQAVPKIVVPGNKFTTVPKSAKTDRGICVEPTLNIFVQLGVGANIRKRLRRVGVNLNSQLWNQELAKRAYEDGLATIDLAQASDTIPWALILEFFPPRWSELLFLCRSEWTSTPDGELHPLEKLSSNGNGYTFEIESLIFWCLIRTFVPKEDLPLCAVYGDDIILPQQYAEELINALKFLGLRTNRTKSFLAGNFFESCGADFFKGSNVRPFYLSGAADDIPYVIQIANSLRQYAHRRGDKLVCDTRFRPVWQRLVKKAPKSWRMCPVPSCFGDAGLIRSAKAFYKLPLAKGGIEGRVVQHIARDPIKRMVTSRGVLLDALLGHNRIDSLKWIKEVGPPLTRWPDILSGIRELPDSPTKGRMTRRGLFGKPVTRRSIVFQWTGGLEWG